MERARERERERNPRINERKSERVKRCLTLYRWSFVCKGMRENDGTRESVKEIENIFARREPNPPLSLSLSRKIPKW
jgi:hypothetical protein